jgi:hypothetical protein
MVWLNPQGEALAPPRHRRDLRLFNDINWGDILDRIDEVVAGLITETTTKTVTATTTTVTATTTTVTATTTTTVTDTTTTATDTTTTTVTATTTTTVTGITTTTMTATTVTTVPKANCEAANNRRIQCLNTLGPNGGAGACKYKKKTRKCVANNKFVDEPEPKPEAVKVAKCGRATRLRDCLLISGPNGGAGACRYDTKKKICLNRRTFVDNDAPPALADCSVGDYNFAACQAILGPNGGADACKYRLNPSNDNFKKCVNNFYFVDL